MQYALMLYEDDAERVAKTEEEVSIYLAYTEGMRKAGILVGGERLQPACNATIVRMAGGRAEVLDGPDAEAKEPLGGFHIIDVPDLDTALAWAARCPSAARGRVEVRPIWPS